MRQRKLAGGVFARAERGVGAGIATRWNGLAGVIAVLVTVLILSAAALASLAPGVITALLSSRRGSAAAAWETRLGRATLSDLTGLYPGAANDIEYIPFAVTNVGGAEKPLSAIVASIAREPNGDAKTADGADIRGCQASWFTVSAATWGRVLPADIGPGRSYTGRIAVTMRDSSTNQDACRDTSPAVTISAR